MLSEFIHNRFTQCVRKSVPRWGCLRHSIAVATAAATLWVGQSSQPSAQNLTPSNAYMSAYNGIQIGGVGVAGTRANAFKAITDGVVGGGNGLDTFNLDGFGIVKDFVGLDYATPQRFDTITVNLGNQFGD